MATLLNVRSTAIALKQHLNTLYNSVLPLYAASNEWDVEDINDELPTEGDVKAVLELYRQLSIEPLTLSQALADVTASTGEFTGLFEIPTTVFPVAFLFAGPVWAGLEDSQGYGAPLTIQRIEVYCKHTGTGGADLSIDVRLDDVSIFSVLPSIPANSGDRQLLVVDSATIQNVFVDSGDILSAHLIYVPTGAEGVTVTVWLKP